MINDSKYYIKKLIDGMDSDDLKHNIEMFKYRSHKQNQWLHSPILTSNTYPIVQNIKMNNFLISLMKTKLEELND